MSTHILSGTGDNNCRGEDLNTNENIDNILVSSIYLNDQTIIVPKQKD